MDTHDLFRKLSAGAKFDKARFYNDALKFQMVKPHPLLPMSNVSKTPDKVDGVNKSTEVESCNGNQGVGNSPAEYDLINEPEVKKKRKNNPETEKLLRQEEMRHRRKVHRIHVSGTDVPGPVESFEELVQNYGLKEDLIKNIADRGYVAPTPVQMQAIPVMLDRRELLSCAPTGSGKTAAFLVPIIHTLGKPMRKGFRAVVVAPTRELAQQIHRECLKLSEGRGLRCHVINNVNKAAQKFGPKSSQRFDILITTPNRLVYLLEQEPPAISLKNVEWLVVDESDKLFEAGRKGFRDQLGAIYRACDSSQIRRAFFSATFTHEVQQWCKLNLDNVIMVTVGQLNAATEIVDQKLVFVGNEAGKLMAFRNLIVEGLNPPVLVFVQTKERAKELYTELVYDGINVDVIHAERSQLQRDNVVKSFRTGKIWVLICTELMGRGIDFKGVNLVINYDFPPTAISYIHRIGRTGRAGRPGKAITFFTEDDVDYLRSIAQVMRDAGCEVPEYMLQMKKASKKKKLKLARQIPNRERISTEPLIVKKRRERLRKKIRQSKLTKLKNLGKDEGEISEA